MIVEDTKDLVETDDYVIIEATLSEGDLLFVQIAVGIRNEVGDIVRAVIRPAISMPISAILGASVGFCGRGACIYCTGHLAALRWSFANYL